MQTVGATGVLPLSRVFEMTIAIVKGRWYKVRRRTTSIKGRTDLWTTVQHFEWYSQTITTRQDATKPIRRRRRRRSYM